MAANTLRKMLVVAVGLSALPAMGCHRAKDYESTVEVTRVAVVRKDKGGKPTSVDVEFNYAECPGSQIEVIRGGAEFATCITEKVKLGDKVKVKIHHHWDPAGHYEADVYDVQGCARPVDPNDEASFKMVRDCQEWNVNGARVGFQCNYTDKKALNKVCPWFVNR